MWTDAKAHLPAVVSDLPEGLRVDFARNDLMAIAAQSEVQVAVHAYATRAADEVLHSLSTMDVPHRERIAELTDIYQNPDRQVSVTRGKVVQQMVAPKRPRRAGISDKSISRDILSELHPDRVIAGTSVIDESESIFKSITEARQNEDDTLAQGLYAGTLASRAAEVEQPTAAMLEMARYKSWLALDAGKGRFASTDEVDVWKDRELALTPVRSRAGMLASIHYLFGQALGVGADGSLSLPSEHYETIASSLESSQSVIERVMGDEVSVADMSKVDTDLFDQKMGIILAQLNVLLHSHGDNRKTWSILKGQQASNFAISLTEIARVLRGQSTAARLGMLAINALRFDLGSDPSPQHYYEYEEEPNSRYSKKNFAKNDIIKNIIKKGINFDS